MRLEHNPSPLCALCSHTAEFAAGKRGHGALGGPPDAPLIAADLAVAASYTGVPAPRKSAVAKKVAAFLNREGSDEMVSRGMSGGDPESWLAFSLLYL